MTIDPDDLRQRQVFDEHIRNSTMRSLRSRGGIINVDETIKERERSARSAQADKCLTDMQADRTALISFLASCREPSARQWGETLRAVNLASSDTVAQLSDLLEEVANASRRWADRALECPAPRPGEALPQDVVLALDLIATSIRVLIATHGTYECLCR